MVEMKAPSEMNIALLAGGNSDEREISLASGQGAKAALEEAGFNVTVLDPANRADLERLITEAFDVAFICLHGRYGEDGTIQGFLEMVGIPYTGSGVFTNALAIDKVKTKLFYREAGILTPESVTLNAGEPWDVKAIETTCGVPCVVKPACDGSAIGVHIVTRSEDIADAVEQVFALDSKVLVERYISGTELTVSVVGNDEPQALPVIQIVPSHDFYDYESKYAPGGSEHLCPAPLSEEKTALVQEIACAAHRALGCRGVSRTDIIMDEEGVCWTLETNTIPGMTGTSLLPDAGRAAGHSFAELCTMLIRFALEDPAIK